MYQFIKNNLTNYRRTGLKYFLTGLILVISLGAFAQTNQENVSNDSLSIFSNALFNTFLGIILLLLIIIAVLANVLKNVADATKDKYIKNKKLPLIATIIMLSTAKTTFAQQVVNDPTYMGLSPFVFYFLIAVVIFEIIIIAGLINSIQLFIRKNEVETIKDKIKEEPSLLEKLNASVAIEEEESILMDHDYDGIKELDNDLPPWWKYGFYLTIVYAFIYLIHYHVTATGDLQAVEYNKTMDAAKLAKEEYQKNAANNVNEGNVTMLTDLTQIEKGATIFKEMCSACHGSLGEGGVGPNMTDDYWIHGGSIKDIFISIKYGWPNKGMKAWENDYSPVQMQQLTSYIKTLRGTNPPNGKEKQGELFVESSASIVTSDSTKTDSTTVITIKTDTTVVTKN